VTADVRAVARERLVDGVVQDLEHHVVRPVPSSVSPMYMPGSLADGVEALQDLILLES
jgi:hypothetical protein